MTKVRPLIDQDTEGSEGGSFGPFYDTDGSDDEEFPVVMPQTQLEAVNEPTKAGLWNIGIGSVGLVIIGLLLVACWTVWKKRPKVQGVNELQLSVRRQKDWIRNENCENLSGTVV